jgi:hypothetical protein
MTCNPSIIKPKVRSPRWARTAVGYANPHEPEVRFALKVPLRGWIGVSLIGAGLMLVAGA